MLTRIEIKDFALIEQIVLEPGRGLLILTGETGAGKSILIDAIGALTGGRVARDMIRHGAAQASAEAIFQIDAGLMPAALLAQLGITPDAPDSPDAPDTPDSPDAPDAQDSRDAPDAQGQLGEPDAPDDPVREGSQAGSLELILSREISLSGKSACRINGRLVSLGLLREVSEYLIDIHGQHDQQVIFRVDSHLQLLDRFGGDTVTKAWQAYAEQLRLYQDCLKEMDSLGEDPAERARQLDLLSYQAQEIASADIRPGEEEQLSQRRRIVANGEKIRATLSEAYENLAGDSPQSLLAGLGEVMARLDAVTRRTQALAATGEKVAGAIDGLQDAAAELRSFLDGIDMDPEELERLDERLDLLFRLKKKYGGSEEAVLAYLRQTQERLDRLNGGEARYGQLLAEKERLEQELRQKAALLSQIRRQAGGHMEHLISSELADLGMKGVQFSVRFADLPDQPRHFNRTGMDQVEFLISANPGEPLRPLARIASGGEASRTMLAIKTILAQADRIPVLIFDEIDTGVSGRTAGKVGEKLLQLAQGRQIFCITHMAQIAAMADEHWLIEKSTDGSRTRTVLRGLDADQRESELARLLSGGVGDETARRLAGQLLIRSRQVRESGVHAGAGQPAG